MFKALLLATWHDLSDVALAEALSDRASFRRFCGFARDEETPERTAFVLLEWSETQTRSQRSASGRAGRRGFEEAVAAFRGALQENTRARAARLGREYRQSRHRPHAARPKAR